MAPIGQNSDLPPEAQAVWEQEIRETIEVYAKWYGWKIEPDRSATTSNG